MELDLNVVFLLTLQVQGKKVKIIFLDETEQWAHISKVKKISFTLNNDNSAVEEKHHGSGSAVVSGGSVVTGSKKKAKGELNGQITPKESLQVTCGSCGTHKVCRIYFRNIIKIYMLCRICKLIIPFLNRYICICSSLDDSSKEGGRI